uniref:Frp1 uORF n=1 Tax=Fusarium oxysporum f. sp. lycopersici TaxID=59765 RepID=Q6B958_FUSOX|nr:Frp1 uORF [Fusarium oxysporum f. sp. lycopersici]
MSSIFSFSAQ